MQETLMRKLLISLSAAMAMVVAIALPAFAAHGGDPEVVVMQHLCDVSIQSEADFAAVEEKGAGGQAGGEGTLPGLVATVLACPTIGMDGQAATDGISGGQKAFNYTITDSADASYQLSDGMFMPAKLCESDIDLDVDGDGTKSATTCLDVSMTGVSPIAEGAVTLTQTAPAGTRFGTIRTTPASTDDLAVLSASNGTIELDTSKDTQVDSPPLPLSEYNDDVVTVHVYNFQNPASSGEMPDTAIAQPTGSNNLPLLLTGFLALIAVSGAAVVGVRRRS
jgi:hypothetical protein